MVGGGGGGMHVGRDASTETAEQAKVPTRPRAAPAGRYWLGGSAVRSVAGHDGVDDGVVPAATLLLQRRTFVRATCSAGFRSAGLVVVLLPSTPVGTTTRRPCEAYRRCRLVGGDWLGRSSFWFGRSSFWLGRFWLGRFWFGRSLLSIGRSSPTMGRFGPVVGFRPPHPNPAKTFVDEVGKCLRPVWCDGPSSLFLGLCSFRRCGCEKSAQRVHGRQTGHSVREMSTGVESSRPRTRPQDSTPWRNQARRFAVNRRCEATSTVGEKTSNARLQAEELRSIPPPPPPGRSSDR